MATVGIWKIQSSLNQVIKYTTNEEKTTNINYDNLDKSLEYIKDDFKTEEKLFVTGINCDSQNALEEMKLVKKHFKKEKGILGFHAYQSFNENEVTPEQAHEIGIKLANEMWGDRFQVLVATHLNTNHYHNHFVINSVSFIDGKKYYDNRNSYAELRRLNDSICSEYNLSVLEEKKTRKGINYLNYQKANSNYTNYYKTSKEDLDFAIAISKNYNDFLHVLDNMNYEVINRYGKLSIRNREYKRNIRIERYYGEDYSIENIKKQITGTYISKSSRYKAYNYDNFINELFKRNFKGIIYKYFKYLHLLNLYPKYIHKTKISYELKKEMNKMDQICEETKYLIKNNIITETDFNDLNNYKNVELDAYLNEREDMYRNGFENYKINNLKINEIKSEIKMLNNIKKRKEYINNNLEKIEKEVIINEHIR